MRSIFENKHYPLTMYFLILLVVVSIFFSICTEKKDSQSNVTGFSISENGENNVGTLFFLFVIFILGITIITAIMLISPFIEG